MTNKVARPRFFYRLIPSILLLVLAALLAYYASIPKLATGENESVWVNIPKGDIKTLTFKSTNIDVEIQRNSGTDMHNWTSVTSRNKPNKEAPKNPESDGHDHDGHQHDNPSSQASNKASDSSEPPKDPEPITSTTREFVGNDKVNELLENFSPLIAIRRLGQLHEEKRAPYGFDEHSGTITIETTSGKQFEFLVGNKSFGSSNIYLYDTQAKELLLTSSKNFETLPNAKERYFETNLTNIQISDLQKATIVAGGTNSHWDLSQRDEDGTYKWRKVDDDSSSHDSAFGTWIDKIAKLKALEYSHQSQEAELSAMTPLFVLRLQTNGSKEVTIEFRKLNESASSTNPGSNTTETSSPTTSYWVKSSFLGRHVKVSSNFVEPIIKDQPSFMSVGG